MIGGAVQTIATFDDGSGEALYAGGLFAFTGGLIQVQGMAKWDGNAWSAVGNWVSGFVETMMVFDDGGGPQLYAGGFLSDPGSGGAGPPDPPLTRVRPDLLPEVEVLDPA